MKNNDTEVIENNNAPSVKKNYLYNLFYQVFTLLAPLITTPYTSRKLLAEGVGKYSFSASLINYFVIFATLGFGYYAQREIAKHQDDKNAQSVIFWEILVCRLIPVSISIAVNIILCLLNVYGEYNLFMWILNISIINVAFDVNFVFQGNERFKSIVLRNILIRIVSIACIFIFIHDTSDLWIFVLINCLTNLLASLSMWLPLSKILVKTSSKDIHPLKHLKGTLILFLPMIAVSIYTILDKTLIGLIIKDTYIEIDENGLEVVKKMSNLENGYYEQSEKIVKMVMTIITSIGIVMIPRNSREIERNNYPKVIENINYTSRLVFMAGIPMVLGLITVSEIFVPLFFGDGYDKCALLINVLSPLIIIIGLSNVLGLQYLIPTGQDKRFSICLITGSIINIILNIIFINLWWSVGAAIATVIAELTVTSLMAFFVRKDISILKVLVKSWKYVVSGCAMFLCLYFIKGLIAEPILNLLVICGIGIVVYALLLFLLHDDIFYDVFKKMFKKLKH